MRSLLLACALSAQSALCLVLTHAPSPVGTSFAPMAAGFSPTAPALVRRSAVAMALYASTDDVVAAPPSVGSIDVGAEGVRDMTTDQKAYLAELLEKCPEKSMQEVWRRAAFWENETATLLEIVNVNREPFPICVLRGFSTRTVVAQYLAKLRNGSFGSKSSTPLPYRYHRHCNRLVSSP